MRLTELRFYIFYPVLDVKRVWKLLESYINFCNFGSLEVTSSTLDDVNLTERTWYLSQMGRLPWGSRVHLWKQHFADHRGNTKAELWLGDPCHVECQHSPE